MNQYTVQFFCGQINYVHAFFKNYKDSMIETEIEIISKIKANISVKTGLRAEEARVYLEKIFNQSKYGCALHVSSKVLE